MLPNDLNPAATTSVGRRLIYWLVIATLYAVVVGLICPSVENVTWSAGNEAAAMLAFGLGILLVFRINTAYDRWWEARKLWGQLVNECRNLALKVRAHADVEAGELEHVGALIAAFPHALRHFLRNEDPAPAVPGFGSAALERSHPPGYVAGGIHEKLNEWNRSGKLLDSLWILDIHARGLMDVCGACERIRNSPIPYYFRRLARWGIFTYALFSPWLVFLDTGWLGFPVLDLAFIFLFSVELTAEAIEEPFGTDAEDLPLDKLCVTIEQFVRETLGADGSP